MLLAYSCYLWHVDKLKRKKKQKTLIHFKKLKKQLNFQKSSKKYLLKTIIFLISNATTASGGKNTNLALIGRRIYYRTLNQFLTCKRSLTKIPLTRTNTYNLSSSKEEDSHVVNNVEMFEVAFSIVRPKYSHHRVLNSSQWSTPLTLRWHFYQIPAERLHN